MKKTGRHNIRVENYNRVSNKTFNLKINRVKSLELDHKKYYLSLNETFKLNKKIDMIVNPKYNILWKSSDNNIGEVNSGEIIGKN